MSEGTWKLVEERRELKARIESAKTRRQKLTSTRLYLTKNCEAKRSCRRDKRAKIDSTVREAEEAGEKKDMKKVYDTTRLLSGKRNIQSKPVKDRNGEVLRPAKSMEGAFPRDPQQTGSREPNGPLRRPPAGY